MPNNSQNLKLSSPTGTLVSCQKAVRVNKKREAEDKTDVRVDNIFKKDILEAMVDLKGASFKLYMYILSNQDNYIFGLSQKDVANRAGIPEATYRTAIKQLIDKKYLVNVSKKVEDNQGHSAPLWEFFARPGIKN